MIDVGDGYKMACHKLVVAVKGCYLASWMRSVGEFFSLMGSPTYGG